MKKTYKYLTTIAMSGAMCLFIALSANAQHRGSDGGGSSGGGSRSSGGSSSGSSAPRPSFTPSSSSRPSGGGFSPRPSGSGFRPSGGGFNPSANRPSFNGGNRSANGVGFNRPGNGNSRIAIAPPNTNNIATGGHRAGVNPGVSTYGGRSYLNNNARSYVGTRGYVGQGGRASVGAGGRGFYGPSYWRNSNYYHYQHGYYGTYYAPRLGFSIGFLPYGYYPFYYGDAQYFYSSGLFYQYDNSEYTVVEPPVGAEVNTLPSNAQSIMINGEQYYEANGVYYEPITKDDGSTTYQVAGKDGELNTNNSNGGDAQQAPQVGDIVDSLPQNCRKISLNNEKYYVSEDGYYYQDFRDSNNNKAYKIVGTPDEAPQN